MNIKVKLKVVEFIKGYPPYTKGETAGFNVVTAEKLVRMNVAKYRDDIQPDYGKRRRHASNGEIDIEARAEAEKSGKTTPRKRGRTGTAA